LLGFLLKTKIASAGSDFLSGFEFSIESLSYAGIAAYAVVLIRFKGFFLRPAFL
jgi:hypothetical protein